MFPSINLDQLSGQVPSIRKKYLFSKDYASATAEDIFPKDEKLKILTCYETRTCWIENAGQGKFIMHALPIEAQFAPVNSILCEDLDGDGIRDMLLAGNEYQTEVMTGRYDASFGFFLKGLGNKQFKVISPTESGFRVDGDIKDMKVIRNSAHEKLVLVGVNNDYLKVFKCKAKEK